MYEFEDIQPVFVLTGNPALRDALVQILHEMELPYAFSSHPRHFVDALALRGQIIVGEDLAAEAGDAAYDLAPGWAAGDFRDEIDRIALVAVSDQDMATLVTRTDKDAEALVRASRRLTLEYPMDRDILSEWLREE